MRDRLCPVLAAFRCCKIQEPPGVASGSLPKSPVREATMDSSNHICSVDGCVKPRSARGWCHMHYMRWQRHGTPLAVFTPARGESIETRLVTNIEIADSGCWLWIGTLASHGYGRLYVEGKDTYAHRTMYEVFVEPIGQGLTIDHLCRVRRCVNPDHLEPVTVGVNVLRGNSVSGINLRKTHCVHGHKFDDANTYMRPNGDRNCRECRRRYNRSLRAR